MIVYHTGFKYANTEKRTNDMKKKTHKIKNKTHSQFELAYTLRDKNLKVNKAFLYIGFLSDFSFSIRHQEAESNVE